MKPNRPFETQQNPTKPNKNYKGTELSPTLRTLLTTEQRNHYEIIHQHNQSWGRKLVRKAKHLNQMGWTKRKAEEMAIEGLAVSGENHINEHQWLEETYGMDREKQREMVYRAIERRVKCLNR